jgi:hypothetical protein
MAALGCSSTVAPAHHCAMTMPSWLPDQHLSCSVSLCQPAVLHSCIACAALNDVASYALIAWQSTLFERCLGLKIEDYAPVLATLLPVAGILGGECVLWGGSQGPSS